MHRSRVSPNGHIIWCQAKDSLAARATLCASTDSVQHSVRVAERDTLDQLLQVGLDEETLKLLSDIVEVLLEVLLEELEDEVQLLVLVDDVAQSHDVLVRQLLQERDLADRRRRDTLILRLEADLLQGNDLLRHLVLRLVDDSVSSLANLLELRVALHADVAGGTRAGSRRT